MSRAFFVGTATYLGLDPEIILDEYRSRFVIPTTHEPFGGTRPCGRGITADATGLAFIAVVCLLILGAPLRASVCAKPRQPEPYGEPERPLALAQSTHHAAADGLPVGDQLPRQRAECHQHRRASGLLRGGAQEQRHRDADIPVDHGTGRQLGAHGDGEVAIVVGGDPAISR